MYDRLVTEKGFTGSYSAVQRYVKQFAVGRLSPSRFMYPEWSGLYMEGKQGLYVNVGLGYIGLMPLRFGAWPEITVITLKQLKMED